MKGLMKRAFINLLAIVAYYSGLDLLFYWLNRKAKRILTFHNVLPDELFREGLANGVSDRFSDFQKIILECGKKFSFSLDLLDADTLTVTFDDGYENQYSTAFKYLKEQGIPAYLFVSGDLLAGETLLIDKLLHWVSEAPIEFIPGGDRLQYWISEAWPRYMADSERKGMSLFESLDAKYPYEMIVSNLPEDYRRERLLGVSDEELDKMREAGWKIGWHTKSHYPLSKLSDDILRQELEPPAEFKHVCLSYPYGNPVEVGETAIKLSKTLGYPCAVSNSNAVMPSLHFLPRMSLLPNRYRLHFQLSGLEHFIRQCRLLPQCNE